MRALFANQSLLLDKSSVYSLEKSQTAQTTFTFSQKAFVLILIILLIIGLIVDSILTFTLVLAVLTFVYFADFAFNTFLVIRSLRRSYSIKITDDEIINHDDENFPVYTILCPLFKEHEVLKQFVDAIEKLNYPSDKLQVLLLFELEDQLTILQAIKMNLSKKFEIVVVPASNPQTKPKALNYGLTRSKGDLVVIYDAEDVPEVDQLKKVAIAFEKLGPQTKCIQAKLNFYNPHQNWLTRVFSAEYSLWFDITLTGLQSIFAPIPLGGTSNHFRLQDVRELGGWDPYNVTEDADLGMRIARNGYQTAIVNSTTFEEANSNVQNWFMQRTRWIKGYMQTYLVHSREPLKFITKGSIRDFALFQIVIGGKILSLLVNPLMWAITIVYFVFRGFFGPFIESIFPMPVFYMGLFSFVFGNFLYIFCFMLGSAKRHEYSLVKYTVFVPLYWLGMSFASYIALYKLLTKPHEWFKTQHGLHMTKEQ